MKHTMKLFAALAVLLALALSLPVVAEDAVVEDAIGNTADESVELAPEISLFDGEILMPEETPEVSAPEAIAAPAEANSAAVDAQPKAASTIPGKLTLGVKETYKIDTTGLKGKITYKSSKTKIATVSKKGVIKAKKAGKAKITITPKKGKKKTITVTVKKAPKKITMDENSVVLEIGDTYELTAALPAKTASNKFTWTSSKPGVVNIIDIDDKWCAFEALKAGTAVITAKTFNGKKATCKVTVKAAPKPTATPTPTPKPTATPTPVKLSVNKKSVRMEEGESVTLKVTYTGSDSIYWKTDDSDVASCKWEDGWDGNTCELTINGWNAGSATIAVYNEAKDKTVSIKVIVTAKPVELTVDKKSVDVKVDESVTVNVSYTGNNTLNSKASDSSVITWEWGTWNNNTTSITIKGKKAGSTVFTIYDEEGNKTVNIPITVVDDRIKVILPDTPITLGKYSSYNVLQQEYVVTDITYEFSQRSSGDFTLEVFFSGNKTYDYRGESQSSSPAIGVKLYYADGSVFDSGTAYGPSLAMGESWKGANCHKYFFDVPEGEYTLKLLSVN